MKVLIYGINFPPDLVGIPKYTGEMAHWLATNGHEMRVVTAPPYYPSWRVEQGYRSGCYMREAWSWAGGQAVDVWRCPLWVPERPSGVRRLLHLGSFAASSLPVMLRQIVWRPDVVFMVEPTLFGAPAALLSARLSGAKAWLHIQDLEVDAAFDMGLLPKGRVRSLAMAIERWLLSRFDRVSTISEAMRDRLLTKDVAADRVGLFPNWVDVSSITPMARPSTFRDELGLADGIRVALYAGNLGEKQGLELMIEAAQRLRDRQDLVFVIAGTGSGRQRLEALAEGLPNVRFLPLQPIERLNDLLNLADVHLLPQRADAADLVMPSKLTGMVASGRPVVATAAPETQVGKVVARCGLVVPPGDGEAFANAIAALTDDAERSAALGAAARSYAESDLAQEAIMARFERDAESLVGGAGR
ncbi:glycosyltransferase WbuB [Algiphilus sp.]|uniref:glycosyltransferase WbuB n=1 Tax=Algiphilus sp. TaxID=1872431 RepID=UPI003C7C5B37